MMRLFHLLVAVSLGLVSGILLAKGTLLTAEGSVPELLAQALVLDSQSDVFRILGVFVVLAVALITLGRMPSAAVSRQTARSYDELIATEILDPESDGGERVGGKDNDVPGEIADCADMPPTARFVRDYLSKNLDELDTGLTVFGGADEFRNAMHTTPLGDIHILAEQRGDLVVINIEANEHPITACASLLGQIAWAREYLAGGREVRGVFVAQAITEELRYVVSASPSIQVCEFELLVRIHDGNSTPVVPSVTLPYDSKAVATA